MSNEPQKHPSQLFNDMRNTLGEIAMSASQMEVDIMKGQLWKLTVQCLVEKYGIKDSSISDQISEGFQLVLNSGKPIPDDRRATIQDALAEFRSEYSSLIS